MRLVCQDRFESARVGRLLWHGKCFFLAGDLAGQAVPPGQPYVYLV
jgi:hypothetical protein